MTEIINNNENTLQDLLATGEWYPMMSPLRIHGTDPTTFWVSEKPEKLLEPVDQEDAQCFRVDFIPELHTRDGADLSTIGRVATLDPALRVQLLTLDNYAYIANREMIEERNRAAIERRQEEAYEALTQSVKASKPSNTGTLSNHWWEEDEISGPGQVY